MLVLLAGRPASGTWVRLALSLVLRNEPVIATIVVRYHLLLTDKIELVVSNPTTTRWCHVLITLCMA